MATRGRKSLAAIEAKVVTTTFGTRPDAPAGLADDEVEIWNATVATEAATFFDSAALKAMLSDYCRHRATADRITEIINQFKAEWLKNSEGSKRYHGLLKMRDTESRAAADKATKLRMTNQARYTPQAASTAARGAAKGLKPWEV